MAVSMELHGYHGMVRSRFSRDHILRRGCKHRYTALQSAVSLKSTAGRCLARFRFRLRGHVNHGGPA
jgi:hypothetical protein